MHFLFTEIETGKKFIDGDIYELTVALDERDLTIMDFIDALDDRQLAGTIKYLNGKTECYPRN